MNFIHNGDINLTDFNTLMYSINSHQATKDFLSKPIPYDIYTQNRGIYYHGVYYKGPISTTNPSFFPNDISIGPAYVNVKKFVEKGFSFYGHPDLDSTNSVLNLQGFDDPIQGYGFNGAIIDISRERILFHELAHAVLYQDFSINWDIKHDANYGISASESHAIFAENVFFAPRSSSEGLRFAHASVESGLNPNSGPNGLSMFIQLATPDVNVKTGENGSITFTSNNTYFTTSRQFFGTGYSVFGNNYANYVVNDITFKDDSYLKWSSSGNNYNSAVNKLLDDSMISSSMKSDMNVAISIGHMVSEKLKVITTYDHSYYSVSAIDRNHILDSYKGSFGSINLVEIIGPQKVGIMEAPDYLALDASSKLGTFLLGSSGYYFSGSTKDGNPITPLAHDARGSLDFLSGGIKSDVIISGNGKKDGLYNILHGLGGDDILLGGSESDSLDGGIGNDILVVSGGSDILNGGESGYDTAFYGRLTNGGISYKDGIVTKPSGSTDKLYNIDALVGTTSSDTFTGSGTGMTFYGNGGVNTYYAGDGPDSFLGDFQSAFPVGNDRLDFSLSKSAIELTTTNVALGGSTNSGVTFRGIGRIDGSAYDDIFHAELSEYRTSRMIYGGEGNDTFYIGQGQRESHGASGSDIFIITRNAGESNIYGGYSEGDDDSIDFSQASPEVVVNLSNNSFRTNGITSYFTGIERLEFGGNSVTINGSDYVDNIRTGSGKSMVNAGGGNDHITVLPVDNATPAGLPVSDVIINGGAGNDEIIAYRAATINGGADNDTITGSYAKDIITGGAGDDTIDAGGGSEVFMEPLNGIDRIDAGIGLGDIDRFWGDMSKAKYSFRLTNERPDELGISLVGGDENKDEMRFVNLEQVSFYVNYYSNETINVSTIIQLLNQDADHRMTGTELGVALRGAAQARAFSTMAMDDSSVDDGSSPTDTIIYDALDPQTLDFTGIYFTAPSEERQAVVDQGIWPTVPEAYGDTFEYPSAWDAPYDPMGSQWGQMTIAPFHGDYIL